MSDVKGVHIEFVSGAMPDAHIELRSVVGREAISRLFELTVVLARHGDPFTDAEIEKILGSRCAVGLGPGDGDIVQGIIASIDVLDHARDAYPRYVARVVPAQWLLTLARSNRIFPNSDVPTMVSEILTAYGFTAGQDFDILISGGTKREYVVQWEESDWDFIQRWLEHEGYSYWFEHNASGEKLVIADGKGEGSDEANGDATQIKAPKAVSYRERNNLSSGDVSTVWDWKRSLRRTPARVAALDYNYRAPHIPLVAKHDVDAVHGFGSVFSYGENFKDKDAAAHIAEIRAQRLAAEHLTYAGETDCARFRVGHWFELENHWQASNDSEYLITALEYRAGHPLGDLEGKGPMATYGASFQAIPKKIPFRPARVTPWPRIHGVLHAHIDADTKGEYAQIDDQGRYKVKMPFDVSGRDGSGASHWIRMAEPYAGARYGSHQPLHKGTEVLVAHIDGNPDRPVIVASVPNAHTVSPVTKANATQSVTQTASGMRLEMEDLQS